MNIRLCIPCIALLCIGFFPTKVGAQSITVDLLFEDFESGIFPPDGWFHLLNGTSTDGWTTASNLRGNAAFHDDHFFNNDNILVTPPLNFVPYAGGPAWLHFLQSTIYFGYRDFHYVEVSIDSGVTFQTIWSDTSPDTAFGSVDLDLSAFAGMNPIFISFRYVGNDADRWWVDEVKVNDISGNVIEIANNPANGHSYYLLAPCSWTEAQATAVELGGNLVTVDDNAEHVWIAANFAVDAWGTTRAIWTGLNDRNTEGTFEWVDGSSSTYRKWAPGEPTAQSADEDHVFFMPNDPQFRMGDLKNVEYGGNIGGALYGLVEKEIAMPVYSMTNLVSPGTATLMTENCEPTDKCMFGYSLYGSGPTTTQYGNVDMSPPFGTIPPIFANSSGQVIKNVNIPSGLSGVTLYTQALVLKASGSPILTNSLAIVFQ